MQEVPKKKRKEKEKTHTHFILISSLQESSEICLTVESQSSSYFYLTKISGPHTFPGVFSMEGFCFLTIFRKYFNKKKMIFYFQKIYS